MIRVLRTSTLGLLRAQAALVPGLRQEVADETASRHRAESSLRAEQEARMTAEAGLSTVRADIAAARAWAGAAVDNPSSGEMASAGLGIRFLRAQTAAIRQSGGPDSAGPARTLEMIIGRQPETAASAPGGDAPTDNSPAAENNPGMTADSKSHLARWHHPRFISGE